MKIAGLRITQKANLGNYEYFEFTADAVLAEDDHSGECAIKLADYVDWFAHKKNRDSKKRALEAELKTNISDERRAAIERWLSEYNSRKAAMEEAL